MSRRKRRNGRDLAIDLTSLLDVIFIVLMAVMLMQENDSAKATAEAENARDSFKDMADSAGYVWTVSVSVPFDENDVTKREIRVFTPESGEAVTYAVSGVESEPFDKLKDFLDENIGRHRGESRSKECLVVLSLNRNDDSILYRDEKAVREIFEELSAKYEDVFIKGYIGEEE